MNQSMMKIFTLISVIQIVHFFKVTASARVGIDATAYIGGAPSTGTSSRLFRNRENGRHAMPINRMQSSPTRYLRTLSSQPRWDKTCQYTYTPGASNYGKQSQVPRLKLVIVRLWKSLHQWATRPRRYSIYVLECENNKYYVGSTSNMKRRLREHKSSRGSKWTRLHKPLRLVREYKRIPEAYYLGKEAQVTAEFMLLHGINNVRGAMFCASRDYTMDDIPALTGFLGHYNELSYRKLNTKLHAVLSDSPSRRDKSNDVCFNCGARGHWANECPQKWKSIHNKGPNEFKQRYNRKRSRYRSIDSNGTEVSNKDSWD